MAATYRVPGPQQDKGTKSFLKETMKEEPASGYTYGAILNQL